MWPALGLNAHVDDFVPTARASLGAARCRVRIARVGVQSALARAYSDVRGLSAAAIPSWRSGLGTSRAGVHHCRRVRWREPSTESRQGAVVVLDSVGLLQVRVSLARDRTQVMRQLLWKSKHQCVGRSPPATHTTRRHFKRCGLGEAQSCPAL